MKNNKMEGYADQIVHASVGNISGPQDSLQRVMTQMGQYQYNKLKQEKDNVYMNDPPNNLPRSGCGSCGGG